MTSISYLSKSPGETAARRSCLKKANDCHRNALATDDPKTRRMYFHLAKLWREMADKAGQETADPLKEKGVVINFPRRVEG
jgi:hypothetical protein